MAPQYEYAGYLPWNTKEDTRHTDFSMPHIRHLAKSDSPNLPHISEQAHTERQSSRRTPANSMAHRYLPPAPPMAATVQNSAGTSFDETRANPDSYGKRYRETSRRGSRSRRSPPIALLLPVRPPTCKHGGLHMPWHCAHLLWGSHRRGVSIQEHQVGSVACFEPFTPDLRG